MEQNQGYKESMQKLDKIDNMTDDEIMAVAKNLLRTVTLDRKQIEDRYIQSRKDFSKMVKETIMNPEYKPTAKEKEKNKTTILLKYMDYLKEEAKLDYNRRLLQMIK